MVASVFGFAAIFIASISPRLTVVGDALAAIFLLSSGVDWAYHLRRWFSCSIFADEPLFRDICRKFYANEIFMFLCFVLSSVLVGLGFRTFRKRKAGPDYVI